MGFEPTTTGATIQCSNRTELRPPLYFNYFYAYLARPEGVEPPAYGLEVRCSVLLSYRRKYFLFKDKMERETGLEPATTSLEG